MNAKNGILGILDTVVKVAFVLLMVMLISKYSKLAYNYGYQIFNQKPVSASGTGREVTVTISEGDGAKTIGNKLAGAGLITDKTLFILQERFSEYHGKEQPGTYQLSTAMTPERMIVIMSGAENAEGEEGSEAKSAEKAEDTEEESSEETADDTSEGEEDDESEDESEDSDASEEENGD
ncbi:endolytic transglycosylase MltG [Butyrivibrio sp. INlla21]|uniref:endolytic transglycosylase MltG n=1 Tax=Butyrivibrio sp. INlla21 TaxID=1520811 RepID=UPI0008EFF9BF|nr:endolytic transglycosylase MltG [Butyrivibrio sp. INlla21]SFU84540.1 UPF0755 protein [Butyrivibrio sp. INlla21]